jgi:hypothetical protein
MTSLFARLSAATAALLLLFVSADLRAAELSDEEKEDGFASIFNGESLEGWVGDTDGYTVEDGSLVCIKEKGGNVFTEKEYANFVLRFEFKLEPGANNGLGIRAPTDQGDVAYSGMELQILDDGHEIYKGIEPYQAHGSVYGIVPAKRGHLKPTGEWNEQEVVCDGRKIKVTLNGEVIVDADLDEASKNGTIDGKDHPGVKRESGHIGFLGHGARLEFKNLRVKELK